MTRISDGMFELVAVVLIICLFVVNSSYLISYWNTSIVYNREDKTAMDASSAIEVYNIDFNSDSYKNTYGNTLKTGKDLIMSLLLVDEGTPYPRRLKILNSEIINLNNDWVSHKYSELAKLEVNAGVKLTAAKDWKITAVELKHDSSGKPYWYYELTK